MAWHGVLFGSATGGLSGVAADLARIRRVLRNSSRALALDCGLEDEALVEFPAATRADFVAGFRGLIARVRAGDGVVVYYSGHGIRLRDAETGEVVHALVPVGASEALERGEFGYVLREELGSWLRELTAVTANVTWIADACFAGGLRGERERGLRECLATFSALRREVCAGLAVEELDPQGNAQVVRVCASASEMKAFEDDRLGGRMTRALEEALVAIEYAPVVCEDLGRRLQRQPLLRGQQPVIAGPVGRWWLSAREAGTRSFTTTVLHPRGTLLAGGRLLDQRVGDCYAVLDVKRQVVATVRVQEVRTELARTSREPVEDTTRIERGATAVLRRAGEPRGRVELEALGELGERLRAGLTALGYMEFTTGSRPEFAGSAPLVGRVVLRDGWVVVVDREGREVGVWPPGEEGKVCAVVEGLGRQAALRALRPKEGEGLPLGSRLEREGEELVVTNGSGQDCYATVYAFGSAGEIELLTRGQPDGEKVPKMGSLRLRGSEKPVVVILCSARVDVRGWTCATEAAQVREVTRSGGGGGFEVLELGRCLL